MSEVKNIRFKSEELGVKKVEFHPKFAFFYICMDTTKMRVKPEIAKLINLDLDEDLHLEI